MTAAQPGEHRAPGDGTRDGGRILACGAEADLLLEQVADGRAAQRDEHQLDCVHCQAALAEFAALWEPVAAAAATPVAVPTGLASSVMKQVQRLAKDTWYTLELTDGGAVKIAARVVATVARDAARQVAGVRVAFGRSSDSKLARAVEQATLGHRHPNAAVGVLGRTAVVDLALVGTVGDEVDVVAQRVQQAVIAELRRNVGLQSVQVNVTVDDVVEGS